MLTKQTPILFSVLALYPVLPGATQRDAFHAFLDLARHAEQWGYYRYWMAEHHNMTGTPEEPPTLRVGSGGVMLPNHSPLVLAEQFGTLETLYPGRVDLGIGRAPGTYQRTMLNFPRDVQELLGYFDDVKPG